MKYNDRKYQIYHSYSAMMRGARKQWLVHHPGGYWTSFRSWRHARDWLVTVHASHYRCGNSCEH